MTFIRSGGCSRTAGRIIASTVSDLTCDEVVDSAPGFALDILDAPIRARVAAHLLRCPGCRRTVSGMQASAAELLDVGDRYDEKPDHPDHPDHPDWPDFTGWSGDSDPPAVRAGRRRLRTVVSVAAAAILVVGSALGPELGQGTQVVGRPVASGVLLAGDLTVGTVVVYAGRTPVVEVRTDRLPSSGALGVVLTYGDGTARRIGQIDVHAGRAEWAGAEPPAPTSVTAVVLVDTARHQVASATFG